MCKNTSGQSEGDKVKKENQQINRMQNTLKGGRVAEEIKGEETGERPDGKN